MPTQALETETDQSTGPEVDYSTTTNDDFQSVAQTRPTGETAKPTVTAESAAGAEGPVKDSEETGKTGGETDKADKSTERSEASSQEVKLPQPLEDTEEDPKAAKTEETKEVAEVGASSSNRSKPGPKRDYTGIDEETARVLAKTPNDVFNYFKKTLPAIQKELSTLREQSKISGVEAIYNNPEGYLLTPEYRQTSQAVENLESEMAFWEEQAERHANGKGARLLACKEDGDLSKKLTYIYGDPIPKGQEAATIQKYITQTTLRLENLKARQQNVQSNYISTQRGFVAEAQKAADKYYPTLSNPEGKVKETLEAIQQSLGPHGRGFSGPLLTRNLYVMTQLLDRHQKQTKEIERLNSLLKSSKRANPLGGSPDPALPTVNGDDIYAGTTNDDFLTR